jgi:hypothetical protein
MNVDIKFPSNYKRDQDINRKIICKICNNTQQLVFVCSCLFSLLLHIKYFFNKHFCDLVNQG